MGVCIVALLIPPLTTYPHLNKKEGILYPPTSIHTLNKDRSIKSYPQLLSRGRSRRSGSGSKLNKGGGVRRQSVPTPKIKKDGSVEPPPLYIPKINKDGSIGRQLLPTPKINKDGSVKPPPPYIPKINKDGSITRKRLDIYDF